MPRADRATTPPMPQSASRSPGSIRRRPDVVARRVGETAVLVHLGSNRIYELNDTGTRIWELAGDGATVDGLIDRLEREFNVDRGQLASEVAMIVDDLVREGLFEDRSDA
jgi:hypothetical protein